MPCQAEIAEILAGIFPADAILTSREDLVPYSFDGTAMFQQMPAAVALARRLRRCPDCSKARTQGAFRIVPRGSGTGLSGGSVPAEGRLCCAYADEPGPRGRSAQPDAASGGGGHHAYVAEAADQAGLFYPPDPGSMKISTIGGNVAENSGGLRGLK